MVIDFVALDFETANRSPSSACAVGAVRVRDGVVVDDFHTLIRPPEEHGEFEPVNARIHGVRARDVEDAPLWPEVYPELRAFIA